MVDRFSIDYFTYRIKYILRKNVLTVIDDDCVVDGIAVGNVDAAFFFSFPPGLFFFTRCLQIERLKKLVGRKGFSNNPAQEISDVMKLFEGDMAGLQKDIASLQR